MHFFLPIRNSLLVSASILVAVFLVLTAQNMGATSASERPRWQKLYDISPNKLPGYGATQNWTGQYISAAALNHTSGELLAGLGHQGLYHFSQSGVRQSGLALKRPVSFEKESRREVTAIDSNGRFFIHKHDLVMIQNGKSQKIKTDINATRQFYAVFSTENDLYIGTAVNGLYHCPGYSKRIAKGYRLKCNRINRGLPYIPHNKRVFLYEEIRDIHVTSKGAILAAIGMEGGLYIKTPKSKRFVSLPWPQKKEGLSPGGVYHISSSSAGEIWASAEGAMLRYLPDGKKGYTMEVYPWSEVTGVRTNQPGLYVAASREDSSLYVIYRKSPVEVSSAKKERMKASQGRRLFYSSAYNFKKKKKRIEEMFKRGLYDGIVIDVKDDQGFVRYHSQVELIKKSGALRPRYDLKKLIKLARRYNAYVVVRVVVFKDPVLYKIPGYAIYDKKTKKPWVGAPGERWIDPYHPELAELYYQPMVRELTELGVDEIQLDYIRFPSDGGVHRCKFRHKKGDKYFSEALEEFIYRIRSATHLPISVDIYGYNGLYRASGVIGQDIEAYGRIADVVSPMLYSSHFGDLYLTHHPLSRRAYELIKHSIRRSQMISGGAFVVRPYLQAFPMKNRLWGYGESYFLNQIRGARDEGSYGFSFWGAMEHMLRVEKAIQKAGDEFGLP